MNLAKHKKQMTYYSALLLEMLVSGYYNEINFFWVVTRMGIIAIIFSAIETEKTLVLRVAPLLFVFLSLQGIREKWHSIAQYKLNSQESRLVTNIVKPEKPVLPNCENEKSRKKELCDSKSEKLQTAYNVALEKYNKRIESSENQIRKIEVNLSLYDQQPIWIYVFLSMACIGLTALTTIEEKKAEKVIEKINSEIEQKDERTKIVNRIIAGRSNLSIAEELGIDRRKIARIKSELGQWQNKQRPVNAQPNDSVVNLRVVKKESA